MKIFKRYKCFFLLASLFVLGTSVKSFALDFAIEKWICIIGETKCCVNGAKSCCEDNGTLYDTWSCDDSCGISGTKQYKYTADSGCGYSTSTRTCCYNGSWSAWDGVCPAAPKQCTGTRPESQTTCYGGKKRRTVTCNTSTGAWTTGAWGGLWLQRFRIWERNYPKRRQVLSKKGRNRNKMCRSTWLGRP